jgi:hypothetical protein
MQSTDLLFLYFTHYVLIILETIDRQDVNIELSKGKLVARILKK